MKAVMSLLVDECIKIAMADTWILRRMGKEDKVERERIVKSVR
jgi:hypothetical protein